MVEKEVKIEIKDCTLFGSICLPQTDGQFPVVLMVHGSGPLDRNENMPGQNLDIFNVIAQHLGKNGIASLRFDKRGCGKSSGRFETAGHFDHIADVSAWIEYLNQRDFCAQSQIFILGHSEGSIIAPQLSLNHHGIEGIILLAPFIQNIESILRQQAAHIKKAINELDGFKGWFYRLIVNLTGDPVKSQGSCWIPGS